jgi:hypothetical protein
MGADEGCKRFGVHIPKLAEPTTAHLALPAEASDVIAGAAVCTGNLGGRTVGDAADVELVYR